MNSSVPIQPAIHQLVSCIQAPAVTSSAADGQITGRGASGFFLGEHRLLSRFALTLFGRAPEVLHSALGSDDAFRVTAMIRDGSEATPDPALLMRQIRRADSQGFTDSISIHNLGTSPRRVPVVLSVGSDLAATSVLKAGRRPPAELTPHASALGVAFAQGGYTVEITTSPMAAVDLAASTLSWDVTIGAGEIWDAIVGVRGTQPDDGAFRPPAAARVPWITPRIATASEPLALLVDWSFGDLRRLALDDPLATGDTFIAAGSPWYFTLFGRDSLWTARMMMPFGAGLAASTLRSLARRQGTRHDSLAAEQPGRIPHEVRPATLSEGGLTLPPVYYGSVDATPLWITTLSEAWRWGLDVSEVEALLGPLQAAVNWLVDSSDADDDGLCEYIDFNGTGLSNQGWKDSGDSVNWHDGTLATAPIALVEVQGYAYQAAVNAIHLYRHFHLPDADRIEHFAQRLKAAFHAKFWIADEQGPRLAIALDAHKRAVDSTTSNPGHVLGTGLLNEAQEASVVGRLMSELDCGVGLRTMSSRDARYNPLSYHNGSIWPHDTAICARGMILAGHPQAAAIVLSGLLEAVQAFDGRLPELFASIDDHDRIVPYPASCRPQAWAAALGPLMLWAAAPLLPLEHGRRPVALEGTGMFDDLEIDGFAFCGNRIKATIQSGKVTYDGLVAEAVLQSHDQS